jgi:predicted ABC-type ATPase
VAKNLLFFAGPNGSGKSTITRHIRATRSDFPSINLDPDQIEKTIREDRQLGFGQYGLDLTDDRWENYLAGSPFLPKIVESQFLTHQQVLAGFASSNNVLDVSLPTIDSYVAACIADFLRSELIREGLSFMMETVMSHPSKLELLREAKLAGYHTVLYFVTTQDPSINVNRVAIRVRQKGHHVDEKKIVERYERSMSLLFDALLLVDEAYLFDNSSDGIDPSKTLVAKKQFGKLIEGDYTIDWFEKYVLTRLR